MNGMFDKMLSHYDTSTAQSLRNATLEVLQQITLAGLHRGGFFEKAAFYGGTCLRIFHGLPRFSEDMDFSLVKTDESFNIENYFDSIIDLFKSMGREVVITKKDKKTFGKIESAFLKDNTDIYNLQFQTEKSYKIKIELDTNPPMGFKTEPKLSLLPYSFMTRCFTLSNLYAGKMHALLFRAWGNRVKGRDWYDFEWYVRNGVRLNEAHLIQRAKDFNNVDLSRDLFIDMLKKKFSEIDIELVKHDVMPYIGRPEELDIWSSDYFLQLTDRIRFEN